MGERFVPNASPMVRKDPRVMVLKVATHVRVKSWWPALDPGSEFWHEGNPGPSMIHTRSWGYGFAPGCDGRSCACLGEW